MKNRTSKQGNRLVKCAKSEASRLYRLYLRVLFMSFFFSFHNRIGFIMFTAKGDYR